MSGLEVRVNVDNFVRAESDRMFAAMIADAGGVGVWKHHRDVAPIEHQPIIRQNRDTLYSAATVDISGGATLTVPDSGDRYLSVMVVNQDHHIEQIYHEPGTYSLGLDEFRTRYVLLGVRILVDPTDPDDLTAVRALQDGLALDAPSNEPFTFPDYDPASLDATRSALLELARGIDGFDRGFGSRVEVDPVRHLVCAAAGWGGLPEHEAYYANVDPGLAVGNYHLTVRDVPVDGFWSLSLYNAEGYFEPNEFGRNNVNSVTAVRDPDGAVTIHFGDDPGGETNHLPIMDGWNYLIRYYRPRPEILDGSWRFPEVAPV